MPIDEGIHTDLQFLILEIKKQASASLSMLGKPTSQKMKRMRDREYMVNTLRTTIEHKAYFGIHGNDKLLLNQLKAYITIASNLERIADYLVNIGVHSLAFPKPKVINEFQFNRYYRIFSRAFDAIYPALNEQNIDLAQQICDFEQDIDDLYLESYAHIKSKLITDEEVDATLASLKIASYLERVGDSLLNIGEAILDVHIGEKMGIVQFRHLKRGLEEQGIRIGDGSVEYRPIMNTRSGCRVARIIATQADSQAITIFYKEGAREKIEDEIKGLKLWQKHHPGRTPAVLWTQTRKEVATLLLEYIEGDDFLEILINKGHLLDVALELLTASLTQAWQTSIRHKSVKADYITQLKRRQGDILSQHSSLFTDDADFDRITRLGGKLEKKFRSPFTTLIHGDFNADNIIVRQPEQRLCYVDVHRSQRGDYVQDLSVFMISNLRIPVFSRDIRQRLNKANLALFEIAKSFAEANNDDTFEPRLGIGLIRSLVSSTRFIIDKSFAQELLARAVSILNQLEQSDVNGEKFSLNTELITYR